MGAWGEGLYDDDKALDVRDSFKVLSKLPDDGDRILKILLDEYGYTSDLEDDGAPTFWLAVADQFEKRGIACSKAINMGIKAIESGADLKDLESRGMEQKGIKARSIILEKLLYRFKNPKPIKQKVKRKNPPKCCVKAGDVYSYSTMDGKGHNAWFSNWEEAHFAPNGWGALVIVETGMLYNWLPWAAYTPITVSPHSEPDIIEIFNSKTILSHGVAYCSPKSSHLKRMGMKLIGNFEVNQVEAQSLLEKAKPQHTPDKAIINDHSICSGAFSTDDKNLGKIPVSKLLSKSS